MEFTREPVIECVVTPKEGSKLVIRSSKGTNQEEYFVDSLEIVSFGGAFFLRTLEKPKPFLLPISDYEILEVREARMLLKHTVSERTVKIGRGRSADKKKEPKVASEPAPEASKKEENKPERRRQLRRRRMVLPSQEGESSSGISGTSTPSILEPPLIEQRKVSLPEPKHTEPVAASAMTQEMKKGITALLPPPSVLISESITKYRENELYKDAFFPSKNEEGSVEAEEKLADKESTTPEAPNEKAAGMIDVESLPEEASKVDDPAQPVIPSEVEPDDEPEKKKKSFWDFARELTNNKQ